MLLSTKIKEGIEKNAEILKLNFTGDNNTNWSNFTRTNFNNIALLINKKITKIPIQLVEESSVKKKGVKH